MSKIAPKFNEDFQYRLIKQIQRRDKLALKVNKTAKHLLNQAGRYDKARTQLVDATQMVDAMVLYRNIHIFDYLGIDRCDNHIAMR